MYNSEIWSFQVVAGEMQEDSSMSSYRRLQQGAKWGPCRSEAWEGKKHVEPPLYALLARCQRQSDYLIFKARRLLPSHDLYSWIFS